MTPASVLPTICQGPGFRQVDHEGLGIDDFVADAYGDADALYADVDAEDNGAGGKEGVFIPFCSGVCYFKIRVVCHICLLELV